MKNAILVQRSSDGDKIIYYGKDGKILSLEPYDNWIGSRLKPGQVVECTCEEGFVHLDCPIHSFPLGPDAESLM